MAFRSVKGGKIAIKFRSDRVRETRNEEKKKKKWKRWKNATRWQSAGKSWMKCLSICRSIHARCTTEKYGDVFSCRFSIRTRKWETTRGLFNIPHTTIFYPLFSMRGSTGSFTGDGYLRCIRRDLALSIWFLSFFPLIRYSAMNACV